MSHCLLLCAIAIKGKSTNNNQTSKEIQVDRTHSIRKIRRMGPKSLIWIV
jgi:hypothetical protein